MPAESLDTYTVQDLAQDCAKQAGHRQTSVDALDPCYELFRRALSSPPDQDAWTAIESQYRKLVLHWLDQYASEDYLQEVFLRFFQAQQNAPEPFARRFVNTSAVMGYLKCCTAAVRIEAWRQEKRKRQLLEKLRDASLTDQILAHSRPTNTQPYTHFEQLVASQLKDEKEQVVFELTYYHDLPPRDIQAERPDLFPDVHEVYRVKENLLKRLRRDQELEDWWYGGGNSTV